MGQYFLRITGGYVSKNKPQEEILKRFDTYQNTLADSDHAKMLVLQSIIDLLEEINSKYPRCKDLVMSEHYSHEFESCYSIHAPRHTLIHFNIYPVKNLIDTIEL